MKTRWLWGAALALFGVAPVLAGSYSKGKGDPANTYPDAPIPGFTGPAGDGKAPNGSANLANYVNPAFQGWATQVVNYAPADDIPWEDTPGDWFQPARALGPVTGNEFDIVSLNDLTADDLAAGKQPGRITLGFAAPIFDGPGPDFAVFENAFASSSTGVSVFAELGYVEVSSDGVNFARFPSQYGNTGTPGVAVPLRFQDATNIYNLVGKHINAGGESWGTPFDLSQLAADPLVTGGQVNLGAIKYVRIVDIPGSGAFLDSAGHPIYDSWVTVGSGGVDLEAIGVLHQQRPYELWARAKFNLAAGDPLPSPAGDTDGDGRTEAEEYAEQTDPLRFEAPAPSLVPGVADATAGEGGGRELRWLYWKDPRAIAAGLSMRARVAEELGAWSVGVQAQTLYGLVEEPVPGAAAGANGEVLWRARVPVNGEAPRYLSLEVNVP